MDAPEVVDDFELGNEEAVDVQIKDKDVNKKKLRKRIDQYKVSYFVFVLFCNHGKLKFYANVL